MTIPTTPPTPARGGHTPGPWRSVAKHSGSENHKGFRIYAEASWALAEVQPGDQDGTLGDANAQLIAAAPALLEACKQLLFDVFEDAHHDTVKQARAAIRAATGGG